MHSVVFITVFCILCYAAIGEGMKALLTIALSHERKGARGERYYGLIVETPFLKRKAGFCI
jgi:hypothetical protein